MKKIEMMVDNKAVSVDVRMEDVKVVANLEDIAIELIDNMDEENFKGDVYWHYDENLNEYAVEIVERAMEYEDDADWDIKLKWAIWEVLEDCLTESVGFVESEIVSDIIEKVSESIGETGVDVVGDISDELTTSYNVVGAIQDRVLIDDDLDTLIRHTDALNVNLFTGNIDDELDYIKYKYLGYEDEYQIDTTPDFDNSIVGKLFKSQGYKIDDLEDDEKVENSVFLKSFIDEIDDGCDFSELVFLVSSDMDDVNKLFNSSITVDTDVMSGFFDTMNGGGSGLNITLEKPFTIDADDVTIVIDDGTGYTSIEYVYGMCGSAWNGNYTVA